MLLGERLVATGALTNERLTQALSLSRKWRMRLGEVLVAQGIISPLQLQQELAGQLGLPFANLRDDPPDPSLLSPDRLDEYVRWRAIPWRRQADGSLLIASCDPQTTSTALHAEGYSEPWSLALATSLDVTLALQARFRERLTEDAILSLWRRDSMFSAREVITPKQGAGVYALLAVLCVGAAIAPLHTVIALFVLLNVLFLAFVAFKLSLCLVGARLRDTGSSRNEAVARAIPEADLPTFTILVPMYKEPDVLPILANALRRLDYPLAKLDIKLVLEEDDTETFEAAKRLRLEGVFQIVRVPPSQPRTKPKACNYALALARGEYCVIYDAEDKPEPDQLRKVVAAFRAGDERLACVQARLNYFNATENFLTRLFALDYAAWFDYYIPALDHLRIPIPLGGTSNHFRTDILRELGGWDPYNVTEDADLGIRITQKGYRVGVIDSTTWEEACSRVRPWIRQRSRWMKGYAQTWLVHMRRPLHLLRSCGWRGFLGFQAFIGGTVLTALFNPVLWVLYGLWLMFGVTAAEVLHPGILLHVNLAALIIGNAFFIYIAMAAPMKRPKLRGLAIWGLLVPFYWLLVSLAAWRGVLQLATNPHHWEKTPHGISAHTERELAEAGAG